MCDLPNLGRWLLTTTNLINTTGVRPHSTLELTIMEMLSFRYFSLPAPSNLCIFICPHGIISGLWPAVPLWPTGPAGPILHPALCISRREDSLNHNRVKKNLRVSINCNFGHWMEPSKLSLEASRDSRSTAKSNGKYRSFHHTEVCLQQSSTWMKQVYCNLINLTEEQGL